MFYAVPVLSILIHHLFTPSYPAYLSSYFYREEEAAKYAKPLKVTMFVVSIIVHEYFLVLLMTGSVLGEFLPINWCIGYAHGFKSINNVITRLAERRNNFAALSPNHDDSSLLEHVPPPSSKPQGKQALKYEL